MRAERVLPSECRVVVAQPIHADAQALLNDHCQVVDGPNWRDALPQAEALIVRNAPVTATMMEKAPHLRIIARVGVGTDAIDLKAARTNNIAVAITPDANSVAVSEHVIALMLGLQRRLVECDRAVRQGRYGDRDQLLGRTLSGRSLGILGFGRIGQRVAALGAAFGMNVSVWTRKPGLTTIPVSFLPQMQDVLRTSDIVSIHLPLTAGTTGIIDTAAIGAMKPGAFLINTARGALVDTAALIDALQSGALAGAALDVFDAPVRSADPIVSTGALLTPHVAAMTEEAFAAMSSEAVDAVLAALAGRTPRHLVLQSNPTPTATVES